MDKGTSQLIKGALILTIAGIISKILSAFYRIPIQNLTSDIGFYFYQQIYPLIATILILTLYSFPAAISKMGATVGEARHHFRYFILPNGFILFGISSLLAVIIYLIAPVLTELSGETHLLEAYYYIALCLFMVPIIALIRGLFQAEGNMQMTAISQVLEQAFRVFIIILASYAIFLRRIPVESIAKYGVIATMAGLAVATIYLIITYSIYRKNIQQDKIIINEKPPYRYYVQTLIVFGFAVALNHMVFVIIQLVDVVSIVPLLEKGGVHPRLAMMEKGIFDRAVPLIQVGIVVGSAFALSFIPFLTKNNPSHEKSNNVIRDAIAISIYLAVGATVGLFILYPEANILLFNDMSGIGSMRIFIIAIGLLVFIMTINAILQSYGDIIRTAIYMSSLFFIKLLLNYLLVPTFYLSGAAIATIISLFIIAFLTIRRLRIKWGHLQLFSHVKWFALLSATMLMSIVLVLMKLFMVTEGSRLMTFVSVLSMIIIGGFVYVLVLLRYHAITSNQLGALPFADRLLRLQRYIEKKERKDVFK